MKRLLNAYFFFQEDKTPYHAASLSFFTIFSIVPTLLLMLFLISQFEGFTTIVLEIKGYLFELFIPTHKETIEHHLNHFVDNSHTMGITGIGYVIFTSMMFFLNYEFIIHQLFNFPKRPIIHALMIYTLITILSPIALFSSIYLSNEVQGFLSTIVGFGWVDTSKLLPYLIVWLLFLVNYTFSLSQKFEFKALLLGSLLASICWSVGKDLFISYVLFNTTYTTLYGPFSVIMIFFLWVYLSWMVFLYGLQFTAWLHRKITHPVK